MVPHSPNSLSGPVSYAYEADKPDLIVIPDFTESESDDDGGWWDDMDVAGKLMLSIMGTALDDGDTQHWLIHHIAFKACVGLLILVNAVLMGVEADFPQWTRIWLMSEHLFTFLFLVEMVIKVTILRRSYFQDRWNLLDFGLVWLSVLDTWLLQLVATSSQLRSLSILRILRLLRLVRVLRLVKQFKQFVLVVSGVIEAMQATFWVAGVLAIAIYVGAIFCVGFLGGGDNGMYPGYATDEVEIDEQEFMVNFNPHVAFGSIGKAMLTLFNIAILAEWTEVVRPLMEKEPALVVFFIVFVMFITFGVMNVIIGMIVDSVMINAREMEDEERATARIRKLDTLKQVQELVASIDQDIDGVVTLPELAKSMKNNPGLTTLLSKVDLPRGFDAEELLHMLDNNGDGILKYEEFVQSFYRMIDSGPFQQVCLMQMGINSLKFLVQDFRRANETRLERIEGALAAVIEQCSSGGPNPRDASRGPVAELLQHAGSGARIPPADEMAAFRAHLAPPDPGPSAGTVPAAEVRAPCDAAARQQLARSLAEAQQRAEEAVVAIIREALAEGFDSAVRTAEAAACSVPAVVGRDAVIGFRAESLVKPNRGSRHGLEPEESWHLPGVANCTGHGQRGLPGGMSSNRHAPRGGDCVQSAA